MPFRPTWVNLSNALPSSSRVWLARQTRDPYVRQRLSHPAAFRSRSAFKLLEIDAKYGGFLAHTDVRAVVDLGAAPGGWSQVVARKLGWTDHASKDDTGINRKTRIDPRKAVTTSTVNEALDDYHDSGTSDKPRNPNGRGIVVAVDLLPITPIPGVHSLKIDFLSPKSHSLIRNLLISEDNPNGRADIILSDMAANFSGNRTRDVESSLDICHSVFSFATENLRLAESKCRKRGGILLLKHFAHPLLQQFRMEKLEPNFHEVRFIKPDASRTASSEGYWLCKGWKGIGSFAYKMYMDELLLTDSEYATPATQITGLSPVAYQKTVCMSVNGNPPTLQLISTPSGYTSFAQEIIFVMKDPLDICTKLPQSIKDGGTSWSSEKSIHRCFRW